jgi:hypothetical protein
MRVFQCCIVTGQLFTARNRGNVNEREYQIDLILVFPDIVAEFRISVSKFWPPTARWSEGVKRETSEMAMAQGFVYAQTFFFLSRWGKAATEFDILIVGRGRSEQRRVQICFRRKVNDGD